MTSSTSHSESRVPWLAVRLIAAALAAWLVGAWYTVKVNPEVAFFSRVHEKKVEWLAAAPATNRVFFVGGSSCMTSIDPVRLRDTHGLNVVNLGLGAGMGAKYLGRYALDPLRRGDRLVISMEQGLMIGPVDWKSLGVQFAAANGLWSTVDEPGVWDMPHVLLMLRPGGYHTFTLLGKALLRQPWYRYQEDEIRPGGWHEVAARRDVPSPGPGPSALSPQARQWLRDVKADCERLGVEVVYAVPWIYGDESEAAAMREANRKFLADVSSVIPVLQDPELGVHTARADYADTLAHPTGDGARLRTDRLADIIRRWQFLPSSDAAIGTP